MESSSSLGRRTRSQISRSVADREASRLARPERRGPTGSLAHATKALSAVTSTPSGVNAIRSYASRNNNNDEWSGPFSVARQMIAARDAAREKREAQLEQRGNDEKEQHPLDEIVEQAQLEQKRKLNPSMRWKPIVTNDPNDTQHSKSENIYVKRRRRADRLKVESCQTIPTLFQLCIDFLVQNFEFVESLGNRVDCVIRTKICEGLVSAGKFDNEAFEAIAEPGLEVLDIVDCASITQDQLVKVLYHLVPKGLEALLLSHAGRCFGPKAVQTIIELSTDSDGLGYISTLGAIAIGGAYLLTDEDAHLLIKGTCQSLSSIEFKACPLLGQQLCSSFAQCYTSMASPKSATLLELVLEGLKLSQCDFKILASTDALRSLRNLRLQHMDQLDDECAESIIRAAGISLEGITLSHNPLLTDDILSCIRQCNGAGNLRSLELAGLKGLTSCGLEAFFTRDILALPQPPALRVLDLSQCAEHAVTDQVVELALLSSSSIMAPPGALLRVSYSSECEQPVDYVNDDLLMKSSFSGAGLVHFNISGAGATVSDKSMENLVKYCSNSLRVLNVSYCPKISNKGLGYLVTETGDQLEKLSIWGMAQLTDEFNDGHRRAKDIRFEVVGSWMKRSAIV